MDQSKEQRKSSEDEVDFIKTGGVVTSPHDVKWKGENVPDAPVTAESGEAAAAEEEEELDPRVQAELERLNKCTDDINQLELQLEEAQSVFRTLLTDSTQQLKATAARVGNCIEKARPYYEALEVSQKAQKECQVRTILYHTAGA